MRSYALSFRLFCSSVQKSISRWKESSGRQSSLRICTSGSSKKQNMWFWLVKFIMSPSSGLLDTKASPFLNEIKRYILWQESVSWEFLIDLFGEKDVAVFVRVVLVLVGVLDFVRVMGHFKFLTILICIIASVNYRFEFKFINYSFNQLISWFR